MPDYYYIYDIMKKKLKNTLWEIITGTTQYFKKIQNNSNSE
jgi:hypothetical protein